VTRANLSGDFEALFPGEVLGIRSRCLYQGCQGAVGPGCIPMVRLASDRIMGPET